MCTYDEATAVAKDKPAFSNGTESESCRRAHPGQRHAAPRPGRHRARPPLRHRRRPGPAMSWVWDYSRSKPTQRLVLLAIADSGLAGGRDPAGVPATGGPGRRQPRLRLLLGNTCPPHAAAAVLLALNKRNGESDG